MATILPNFEYDIFISYRHNDNRSGWVTDFVNALQEELASTIKEPLTIYFDKNPHDGLLETHNVDKSLEGKLKCLILIPIISQTYCDPKSFAWQHEFCAFNKLAKQDEFGRDIKLGNGNVASRILPIKIHDLDAEDKALIENEIGGVLRAIEFIYKEPGVNRPLKVSDKKEDNQNHTDYTNQLNKVANAIKEIISAIKNPNQKISQATNSSFQPTTKVQKGGKNGIVMAAAVILIAVLGYVGYQKFANNQPSTTTNETSIDKSIAVLPFVNMSKDEEQEYFSDGLSEELLNLLAKIPDLKVIARTSSFAFKGKNEDLRTIGEKLGVAHILEGSVRKDGDQLRITAQLIRVEDGTHLWSETYDRKLESIFKVQDEIAAAVVNELKLKLLSGSMATAHAMKQEAYSIFLQAKFFAGKSNRQAWEKAEALYKQALTIDPQAAAAWVGLAVIYDAQVNFGMKSKEEGRKILKDALDKALSIDPNNADAYTALGVYYMTFDFDWKNAMSATGKALVLDPNNSNAVNNMGSLLSNLGKVEEAIEYYNKSIATDPLRISPYSNLTRLKIVTKDFSSAEVAVKKGLEINPEQAGGFMFLSKIKLYQGQYDQALEYANKEGEDIWKSFLLPLIYYKMGKKKEANATLNLFIEKYQELAAYQVAEIYAYRNEKDKAFQWLEKAYTQQDPGLTEMYIDELFVSLHDDPRWILFLRKMKLVE